MHTDIEIILDLADQKIQAFYEIAWRMADKKLLARADNAATALTRLTPLLRAAPELLIELTLMVEHLQNPNSTPLRLEQAQAVIAKAHTKEEIIRL